MLKRTFLAAMLAIAPMSLAQDPATRESATTKETPKPETVAVSRGTVIAAVNGEGYFEPIDPLEVRLKLEAYQGELKIASIATHGTSVKTGDVLLQIDPTDLQKQLAAAKDELANADANVVKSQIDVTLGEQSDAIALKQAQDELSKAEFELKWFDDVDGKQYLTRADLNVKSANDNVDDQQDELNELKKMYKSEELTSATADIVVKRAVRQLERTKIFAAMAAQSVEKQKGFDFQRARQALVYQLDRQKIALASVQAQQAQTKVTRSTAMEAVNRSQQRAREKFDDLNKDLASFTVKAPSDGMALYGSIARGAWRDTDPKAYRLGEKVQPNAVLMTVVTPGKLRFVSDLPESQTSALKAGQKARIVPLSLKDAATNGTTEALSVTGYMREATQMFSLPIAPERIDPRLLPGSRASVRIDAGKAENAMTLPVSAVSRGQVKLVDKSGAVTWQDVITGLSDGKIVEIKQGLNEGDSVLKNPE